MAEDDDSKSPSTTSVNLICPSGEKPKPDPDAFTYNDFGIYDDAQEKQGFYFAVGPTIISGGFGVGGRAEVTANVGDVIEATASLQASLTGDLFLSLNEFGGYLCKSSDILFVCMIFWFYRLKSVNLPAACSLHVKTPFFHTPASYTQHLTTGLAV